jgi:hypothetical protein
MNGAFEIRCGITATRTAAYFAMRVIWLRAYTGSPVIDDQVIFQD